MTMTRQTKSRENYVKLLKDIRRIQLKKMWKLIELLRDKKDLVAYKEDILTLSENEINNIDLSVEEVKDIYFDLSTKSFEVFPAPDKPDPTYIGFNLPNPTTSKSVPNNKTTTYVDIRLFSKNDLRSNNLRNFRMALQNKVFEDGDVEKLPVQHSNYEKEPTFDALNHTIYFGTKHHTFQKGGKNKKRIELFKLLWEDRRVIKNEKITKKGKPTPKETVATNIGIIESSQKYFEKQNMDIRNKFDGLIKGI